MPEDHPRYASQGDAALLVYLGRGIDPDLNQRVRGLAAALAARPIAGVREVLAAYCCLQVQFDPLAIHPDAVRAWIGEHLAKLPHTTAGGGRVVEAPVVYGGEHGPDLDFVAGRAGVTPQEVIARHSAPDYLCYLVGFSPAFPFLGGMDPGLACPRLESPRPDLPVGAVGIGGAQTGLYTLGGPGGWRIIGRTPLLVYDPRRHPAGLIQAGDRVRFRPAQAAEFPELPASAGHLPPGGRPVLEVLHPGLLTTVQDAGRWGYQFQGVPVSGALDQTALAAANLLLGNPRQAAALELTLVGPRLKAVAPVKAALTGADLGALVDGRPVPRGRVIALQPGQVLSFNGPSKGARAILALEGGVWGPIMMGSRSVYPLGRLGEPLKKGQVLLAGPAPEGQKEKALPAHLLPAEEKEVGIRVLPGPNLDYFTAAGLRAFYASAYELTQGSDRRGMLLSGAGIQLNPDMPDSILSEPNTPGVIQVPSGGQPIIQLREQTVGGYAKIATVISADLGVLARLLPGSRIRFRETTLEQALAEARALAHDLARLGEPI